MKTTVKKRMLKNLIVVLLLLGIGSIWQDVMIDKESRKFLPQGNLYTINSHNMHLYGLGEGNTTIVFIAGSGTPNAFTDYYYYQQELQQYARTVSYDRAGFGWSEKTNIPRTIDTIVEELHELLKKANESPPYLLVGHSLASLEVIRFAQQYPDEVKGILLLDSGSPEYYANDLEAKSLILNRFTAGLRVTGIARALGSAGILLPFAGENLRYDLLPNEMKEIDIAMYYRHLGDSSNLNFISHMNENAKVVMDGGYLKDIPFLILSSESGSDWDEVQQQLLHWSNKSVRETIPASQHYIHWSNKEVVLKKIVETLTLISKDK
ncbi:alpha/beta hydrolase [Brevibacillus antibioticus]|uniref:Alpha/beta hydrolase n=1 Tax=Brevibacillus antibioticus TaxID=2570228 RepID=A0A4U2YA68_9BACL|nr:alpha/beta hydrolase [Brevibacillus antibioticus]TKI57616.1 alpha/beta hydrolase [Brevibacillus antibioticus]